MEYIHVFEIFSQVFPLIFSQNPQRQADQGPEVHGMVWRLEMLGQVVNLGMAVVAAGDAVVRTSGLDLLVL